MTTTNTNLEGLVEIRPARGLLDLDLRALWRYRELLYFLIWRDLKVRYKQAAIGAAWVILQPLTAVLIFTVVFGYFAKLPSDGVPYPLFVMIAILPWTYFAEALRRGATGLVDDGELIRKIYFPRLIIPIAVVLGPVVDLAVSCTLLVALMVWYGIAPTVNIVFIPLLVLVEILCVLALSLWLGPINVRFRDIKHTVPFMIQVWMYASPVVYPASMIPEQWRLFYSLNPMVGVIEGFRWALLDTVAPDFRVLGIGVVIVMGLLFGGLIYFRRMERFFADVI